MCLIKTLLKHISLTLCLIFLNYLLITQQFHFPQFLWFWFKLFSLQNSISNYLQKSKLEVNPNSSMSDSNMYFSLSLSSSMKGSGVAGRKCVQFVWISFSNCSQDVELKSFFVPLLPCRIKEDVSVVILFEIFVLLCSSFNCVQSLSKFVGILSKITRPPRPTLRLAYPMHLELNYSNNSKQ